TFRHCAPFGPALRGYAPGCGTVYAANLGTVIWLGSRVGHGSLLAQAFGNAAHTGRHAHLRLPQPWPETKDRGQHR
ncbi:hypothetical protein ACU4GI_27875, partial [Cupriavidus basilensis]